MTVATLTTLLPAAAIPNAETAGAKAYRLAEMLRHGLQVPGAVVVPCCFLDDVLERTGVRQQIDRILESAAGTDRGDSEAAARQIEELFVGLNFSDAERRCLSESFEPLLAAGPVVVRSSARGEDSEHAAFAGLMDSFLDCHSSDDVLLAVRRCWASCWSHRSLCYQNARSVRLTTMGVIIQEQVDAVVSGVLFTQNPADDVSEEMLLEYCSGTAERLVSGAIVPQRVCLDWNTGEVLSQSESAVSGEVSREFLKRTVEVGRSIERLFGGPQDIEWCLDRKLQLCLVQSRPITATKSGVATVLWSNANVNENYPGPICPLLYSVASCGYYHYFRNLAVAFGISGRRIAAMDSCLRQIVGTQAGRLYYNLTNIHAVLRAAPLGEFLASSFNLFVGAESTRRNREFASWQTLSSNRLVELLELTRIAWHAVWCLRGVEQGVQEFEARIDAFAERTSPKRLSELSDQDLRECWEEFRSIRSNWTSASLADAASMISYQLTSSLLRRYARVDGNDGALVNRLLSGLTGIVSGLPAEKLWQLSRSIRQSPELTSLLENCSAKESWDRIQSDERFSAVRDELNRFIDEWGFRCSGELMLSRPCYQEQPEMLIPIIASYASREGTAPHDGAMERSLQREEETRQLMGELKRKSMVRWFPLLRVSSVANRLLKWTQRSVMLRERARLKQALLYRRLRRLALQVGERLVQRQILEEPSSTLFLTWDEVQQLLRGDCMLPGTVAGIARQRAEEIRSLEAVRPPDRIRLRIGEYWNSRENDEVGHAPGVADGGIGVCGGRVRGRAVVLDSPDQFAEVREGDILITCQTDPGWGPVLFLVRGLVMERGGMLSHGAILAREFGIPSVVGLADATKRFATGDHVLVDGDLGIVRICDD